MTQVPLVQVITGRALVSLLVAALAAPDSSAAFSSKQTNAVNPLAASMYDFQQRLNAYLKLREEMSRRLKPLAPTASAADLSARQEALASAIRTARRGAKPGDLVGPVAELVAKTCMDDFHFRNPQVTRAALQEVTKAPRPLINGTFPEETALPTVPPLLLSKLPQLPDNLQYRFFGRHMVILDGDTQIIIDYVANALPPQ